MALLSMLASAHDAEIDGIFYNLNTETKQATVTFKGDDYLKSCCYSGDVTIPSTVSFNNETYTVTSIGNDAFHSCSSLKSVKIPESVTSIGKGAFFFSTSLKSVNIPESVTTIGIYAFGLCDELESITIPSSIRDMKGAFLCCEGLKNITISDGVKKIPFAAFVGCKNITNINVMSKTPPEIDKYSFEDKINYRKASLNVPIGCKKAYSKARGWKKFKKIAEMNTEITEIDDICYKLNLETRQATVIHKNNSGESYSGDITIPSTVSFDNIIYKVTSIGDFAFLVCSALESVNIPESVTTIGEQAFLGCKMLNPLLSLKA